MCRLLIILNKNINQQSYVEKFLLQSITKKNTPGLDNERDFNYHKDGYGFILQFENDNFYTYKSPKLYQSDPNFNDLLNKMENSNFIIGHLRSIKTEINDNISYNNTHPFYFLNNYWLHNGSIKPFDYNFFKSFISPKYLSSIKGTTDSELLFYIFLSLFDKFRNSLVAWKEFFNFLESLQKENIVVSANIIYLNNKELYISRFINNEEHPPSLYFDNKNMIISSEPVTENFKLLDKNSFLRFSLKTGELKRLKTS